MERIESIPLSPVNELRNTGKGLNLKEEEAVTNSRKGNKSIITGDKRKRKIQDKGGHHEGSGNKRRHDGQEDEQQ